MNYSKVMQCSILSCGIAVAILAPRALVAKDGVSGKAKNDDQCAERINANGQLVVEGRKRAKFHVDTIQSAKKNAGRLDFNDKNQGIRIRSRNLMMYEVVDTETRRLTFDLGSTETNLNTAVVTLRDLGRKGRDDFFEIAAGDYLASGNLRGGQVRLRSKHCDDSAAVVPEVPLE
jgi:hypothetical protein